MALTIESTNCACAGGASLAAGYAATGTLVMTVPDAATATSTSIVLTKANWVTDDAGSAAALVTTAGTCDNYLVRILNSDGTPYTGNWITVDTTATKELDILILDQEVNSLVIKLEITYNNNAPITTTDITITNTCPANTATYVAVADLTLTLDPAALTTPAGLQDYQVSTAAGGYALFTPTATNAICQPMNFQLKLSTGTPATGDWVKLEGTTNALQIDQNKVGKQTYKIHFTENGVAKETNAFTIDIKCPAFTKMAQLADPAASVLVATTVKADVHAVLFTGEETFDTGHDCALTYAIVDGDDTSVAYPKSGDPTNMALVAGTYVAATVPTFKLEIETAGTPAVQKIAIKISQNGADDIYTDPFTVTLKCPDLVWAITTAKLNAVIPVAAAATPVVHLPMAEYVGVPALEGAAGGKCVLTTFALVNNDATHTDLVLTTPDMPVNPTDPFIAVDAATGIVTVQDNNLGSKTFKVKFVQAGITYYSNPFIVSVACAAPTELAVPDPVNIIIPDGTDAATALTSMATIDATSVLGQAAAVAYWVLGTTPSDTSAIPMCMPATSNAFQLYEGATLLTNGAWLAIDAATGAVSVDQHRVGKKLLMKVKITTQSGATFETNTFTLEVYCPTYTILDPSGKGTYTQTYTGASTSVTILSQPEWITIGTAANNVNCQPKDCQIIDTGNSNAVISTFTFDYTTVPGTIALNWDRTNLIEKTGLKIQFKQNNGASFVTVPTAFDFSCKCAAITVKTVTPIPTLYTQAYASGGAATTIIAENVWW